MVDCLPGNDVRRLQADVVGARVEVPQEVGEVAAGNLDPDAGPLQEDVAGGPPELDQVLVHFVRLDLAELARVERAASLGISESTGDRLASIRRPRQEDHLLWI